MDIASYGGQSEVRESNMPSQNGEREPGFGPAKNSPTIRRNVEKRTFVETARKRASTHQRYDWRPQITVEPDKGIP